eukprot:2800594-Pyramimonas_sp.AAC.1
MVELKMGTARQALTADRLALQLDDAMKERRCEFFHAAEEMIPEGRVDVPPPSFPMTRKIEGCDLVARRPVDRWGRSGKRAFT